MSTRPDEMAESLSLKEYTEKAYLDYSMYVILDRALPHIGDGLKPVQRRIIYAMSELGLSALAKFKKSARTVGDVLGKYHPHGDSACYEAMVLMAQPFSFRYPLVDGQGNWGSADDPKSFAAMRYTEARLSKFAELLLGEVGQGTVDWQPNFDGTLREPTRLPARLPHILLNGTTGIAVGMATDIPPHNLREVASACLHLLEDPEADTEQLMHYVQAPDFPTGGQIVSDRNALRSMYETGRGSVRVRACYQVDGAEVVITELPHQVSGARVLEQIAQQMQAKKLPMVVDLRDESDHENPTRLVIVMRSNRVDADALMAHLFATTDLEKNVRVNINCIGLDGRPGVRNLRDLLTEWLQFRRTTVTRRLQYRLDKVLERLHILEGLLVAFLNIDEVIAIIRNEDEPKPVLMARFELSDRQAEAILELKLRHLARLEEVKIRGEQQALEAERKTLEATLASPKRLTRLIASEIRADADKFGDERRTRVEEVVTQAQAFDETQLVPSDPVTIVLSEKGWIRAARGHDIDPAALNYKSGDQYKAHAYGRTNRPVVFLDNTGRGYTLIAHTLPSARGQGEPISGRVNLAAGAQVEHVMCAQDSDTLVLGTDAGYGFITTFADLQSKNRSGKAILTVPEAARILPPLKVEGDVENYDLVVISNEGRMLVFALVDLPKLAKGKGNKLMSIPAARARSREEVIAHWALARHGDRVVIHAGRRHLGLQSADLEHYRGERGRRGMKLPRGLQRVDRIEIERAAHQQEAELT